MAEFQQNAAVGWRSSGNARNGSIAGQVFEPPLELVLDAGAGTLERLHAEQRLSLDEGAIEEEHLEPGPFGNSRMGIHGNKLVRFDNAAIRCAGLIDIDCDLIDRSPFPREVADWLIEKLRCCSIGDDIAQLSRPATGRRLEVMPCC